MKTSVYDRCYMCNAPISMDQSFSLQQVVDYEGTMPEGSAVKLPRFGDRPVCLHHNGVKDYVKEIMTGKTAEEIYLIMCQDFNCRGKTPVYGDLQHLLRSVADQMAEQWKAIEEAHKMAVFS